jgi:sugar (pentulose or hexulose) kinase
MRQMIADATGLPVECPPGADEASALGAAALAWAGLGYALPDLEARSQTLPRPGEAASYEALWQEIQRFGRTLGLSSGAEPLANSEHSMLTRKAPK